MQRHGDYIRRVGNRMVEYSVEPTRDDFGEWLRESEDVTEERRVQVQVLYEQAVPIWEIVGKFTNTEELSWWQYIDSQIDERTD